MIKKLGDVILINLSDMDSNIYLVGEDAIDAGTGFNFTRLYTLLQIAKKEPESIRNVVNTHCHFDHTGGNGYFLEAKVAAHEIDSSVIETGDMEKSVADYFNGNPKPKTVTRKLKEGDVLPMGTMELKVIHTPGHTPGSICLYDEKSGTLFSGDTVFADGFGRYDLPGGDKASLKASLEKLSKLKINRLFPGHGQPVLSNGGASVQKALKLLDSVDEDSEDEFLDRV